VHPRVDFDAWATSTSPLPLSMLLVGFKALRNACCFGGTLTLPIPMFPLPGLLPQCDTVCVGGYSVPVPTGENLANCGAISGIVGLRPCPTCYVPTTYTCSPPNGPANT
jgi:hypothetical protein